MAWATAGNIVTTNLDEGTDHPALARPNLKSALDEIVVIANNLGVTEGAAKIEANGFVSTAVTGVGTQTGNLTITSATDMIKVENFINLNPVAYASLPASPAAGDVAFLTTDGAGASKNKPIYSTGSGWKYFNDDSTVAAS